MNSKAELRAQLLKQRKSRIIDVLIEQNLTTNALSLIGATETDIALYNSTPLEPPTGYLLSELSKTKNIYLPKVNGQDLVWFKNPKEFQIGAFNILEPKGEGNDFSEFTKISTLILPAFAVTKSGIRIGKGGGYYDRLLAKLNPSIKKIALVFDDEILEEIPHDSNDQKIEYIVSESKVIKVSK